MALAEYFGKNALGAWGVLSGFDYQGFADKLEATVVGLAFDDNGATSFEGSATLDLAMRLLARLYPRIALRPVGQQAQLKATELCDLALSINGVVEISSDESRVAAWVVVGTTRIDASVPTIYAGSDGWAVRVSSRGPVGSGNSELSFAAGAAACLGAAGVFRVVFRDQLPDPRLDEHLQFSILDLDPTASRPFNPPFEAADIGESHLVGAGAIGNGALWAFSRTPGLRGVLNVVDDERVELSNIQRYVLSRERDVGREKVALAKEAFAGSQVEIRALPQTWGAYLRERGNSYLETVAVAVDSAEDRIAVQAALPRWVVNAWTRPENLGVSRHDFLGDYACLACLYLPTAVAKHEDQIVAEALRMPHAVREIRQMLFTGAPVSREFLEAVATACGVAVDPLLQFCAQPLRSFYREFVCGGLLLRLRGADPADAPVEVPLSFQSALAGILLATELVAHTSHLKTAPPPLQSVVDILRPFGSVPSSNVAKHPAGRCICQDPDFREAYSRKYVARPAERPAG